MSLIINPALRHQGYIVEHAALFDGVANGLTRTASSAASNAKEVIFSFWMKKWSPDISSVGSIYGSTGLTERKLYLDSSQQIEWDWAPSGNVNSPVALLRDPTSWMHVCVSVDTSQATGSERTRIWLNGVEQTDLATTNWAAQDSDTTLTNTAAKYLGRSSSGQFVPIYMAQFVMLAEVSIQQGDYAITDFVGMDAYGNATPINLAGLNYQANDFDCLLNFETDGDMGLDSSGQGNDWSTSGSQPTQVSDTPTDSKARGVGNAGVFNAVDTSVQSGGADSSFSNGNKTWGYDGSNAYNKRVRGTLGIPTDSGKWYIEAQYDGPTMTSQNTILGWGLVENDADGAAQSPDVEFLFRPSTSVKQAVFPSGNVTLPNYLSNGDVMQIAYDSNTGNIWLGINDTYFDSAGGTTGDPSAGTNATGTASFSGAAMVASELNPSTSGTWLITLQTTENDWSYSAPTGFKSYATQNLPYSTARLSDHFSTVLYTGNGTAIGSGGNPVAGAGFQPDFVWIKNRSSNNNHELFDTLRGAEQILSTSLTNGEVNDAESLASFDSDGFTVGDAAAVNASGNDYVAWCASLPSDETNSSGDITVTWKYNTTLGMAVGTYTGTGIAGNTLGIPSAFGKAPFMVVGKERDNANSWTVGHDGLTSWGYKIILNSTVAESADSTIWNSTAPTSSAITLGSSNNVNRNGGRIFVIAFFETDLCKPIDYTGNGDADGPVSYLDGQPAYNMIKRTDAAGNDWYIRDSTRDPYNPVERELYADLSSVEANQPTLSQDFLATGLKVRGTNNGTNASGGSYIGVAFVNPLKPKGRGQVRGVPN